MGLIYQLPWTRQPLTGRRGNRANGLARGLVYLDTDLAQPQNCADTSIPAATLVAVTRNVRGGAFGPVLGVGAALSTTAGYAPDGDALSTMFAASGEASVFVVVRSLAADAGGGGGPVHLRGTNTGNNEHYPYSDGSIYLSTFAQDRWVDNVVPSFPLTEPHSYCATHKSGSQAAYLNGAQITTAARVETPALAPNAALETLLGANGALYFVAFWNRILEPGEVARLHMNPWQLFAPLPRRIWAPSSSASVVLTRSRTTQGFRAGSRQAA